jgi:LytS/YehU family sensor histidine kinase
MCLLLADFLRDSLTLGAEAQIPLSRELDLVSRFLDIERVRFGDRLRAEFDIADAGSCLVPPLALQPLVENAVTHGIAHLLTGGTIRIEARCSPARLFITITNPCDRDRPTRGGAGVGLANVRGRLRALHADEARVDAVETDGTWRVEVTMPAVVARSDDA